MGEHRINTPKDRASKAFNDLFIGRFFQPALLLGLALCAQTTHLRAQQPPATEAVAEVRPASHHEGDSTRRETTVGAPAQLEPVTVGGLVLKSRMEFGPRWRDFDGNEDVYRSHVNLGNGLRLFHSSFELSAPESSGRLFDRLTVSLDNWGGDPYNTAEVRVKKNLWYDFQYRYQKIDYFNFIPEFANPAFGQALRSNVGARQASGRLLGQHSFDTTRRIQNAHLDLFPHAPRFQAHASYARNSAFGPAFTTVNLGGDEFLISRLVKNSVNDYRFGVDVRFWKLGISFEQRFRNFKDDQGNVLPGNFSLGNNPDPIFDFQQLFLTEFQRSYSVRGFIPTTRVAVTSRGLRRVAFTARFYHSDAEIGADVSRAFSGVVFNRETGIFAANGFSANRAEPSRPYTVADGTVRVRVTRRLAVMNTFRGAHFVIAGSTVVPDRFTDLDFPQEPVILEKTSYRRDFLNSFMNQFQGDYALTNNLIVHAGFRFEHRRVIRHEQDVTIDSRFPEFPVETKRDEETTQNTNTVLMGANYRWRRFIRIAFNYENGGYQTAFTRVGPRDFQRGRVRLQLRPDDKWIFTASGFITDETRPNLDFSDFGEEMRKMLRDQNRSRGGSLSVSWFPNQRVALDLDYTRRHTTARIYTIDQGHNNLPRPLLLYKEDSNVLHSGLNLTPYKGMRIGFGYRLVNTSGSFPINFHRPYARLSVPLHQTLTLNLRYQHYGYNERGRSVQDYRANLLKVSLTLSF